MHRLPVRALTAVAVALTAGLAVTGCTPPNEQPSDQKVENAVEAPAGQATGTETSATTPSSTDNAADPEASIPLEDPAAGEFGEPAIEGADEFGAEGAGEIPACTEGIDCAPPPAEVPAEVF